MARERKRNQRRPVAAARRLRRDATMPERLLWGALRDGRLGGLRFRRQHPIGTYIADFYCHSARLIVEIDGMSHADRAAADRRRTKYLESMGHCVVRFTNDDVLTDIDAVAEAIIRAVQNGPLAASTRNG